MASPHIPPPNVRKEQKASKIPESILKIHTIRNTTVVARNISYNGPLNHYLRDLTPSIWFDDERVRKSDYETTTECLQTSVCGEIPPLSLATRLLFLLLAARFLMNLCTMVSYLLIASSKMSQV